MNNSFTSLRSSPATHALGGPTAARTLRRGALALSLLLWSATAAVAQVSVTVAVPGVSIGVNTPQYPQLVRVPNYPVYYAPGMQANYFFYDGAYWVYQQDNWYRSSWYNGPWGMVNPQAVPVYVLRIPVRYYRNPPDYFQGWQRNAAPRWGEHWGNDWAQQRNGWDHRDRRAAPAPAPLPTYQRQYSGNRYPQAEQQQALHSRNYRFQPRDAAFQQHDQQVRSVVVPPRPEQHDQRQGQGQGQGRGDGQGKGHEQDRDNDGGGRQHKK
jgi:hypothetical protein